MTSERPLIGVVGPCASGKTTLVAALRSNGYRVRHIAQEHSYVSDMWKQISNPDFLIYLDVSFEESMIRSGSTWTRSIFEKQVERLKHAYKNADLIIETDDLKPEQVLKIVLDHIN
jgi:molybdopterin-guanine dinucleotide biosynthesis protein